MVFCHYLLWSFIIFNLILKDGIALKNVVLSIEPNVVRRLHNSTLRCFYDLERAKLYSVKWYRGKYEFYRYTPSEHPKSKIFLFGGITVDMNRSNSTQVVLTDIEFNMSGNFTCEVTTTEEPASTGTDTQAMLVVQFPDFPPTISVGREPLDYGDTLRANCTASPARPPATLKFILNNITVAKTQPLSPRKMLDVAWSDLPLELVLTEHHFNRGRLVLQCVAQVLDIYHEEAILELDSARAPISERVSAFSTAESIITVQKSVQVVVFYTVLSFFY